MGYAKVRIIHDYSVIDCFKCGVIFAVDETLDDRWRKNGDSFYCPNGHSQHYSTSEIQKLEKKLKAAERRIEWSETVIKCANEDNEHLRNTVRAEKGAKTKLKKRFANGVCPCCKRSFTNVKRHMAGQHPDYGDKK